MEKNKKNVQTTIDGNLTANLEVEIHRWKNNSYENGELTGKINNLIKQNTRDFWEVYR